MTELVAKRLELLREMVPAATRVAVLVNPSNASSESTVRDMEAAARAMGLQIQVLNAEHQPARSMRPSQRLCASGPTRFSSSTDPFFSSRRVQLAHWQRATRFPRYIRSRDLPKSAG